MTQEEFDNGYKLLRRYMKDIGKYHEFIKITAKCDASFPKKLKNAFDKTVIRHNPLEYCTWYHFFSYVHFVGNDWQKYYEDIDDYRKMRTNWYRFLKENNFDGLKYINKS